MKLSRLLGLFFLSLLLTACWLSTLPCAEDPWDENKIAAPDTGAALGGGGTVPGDGGFRIVIIPGGASFTRIFDFSVVIVSEQGSINIKKEEAQRSSMAGVCEPGVAVPGGKSVKAKK